MIDVPSVLTRARAKGADVTLERGKMTVINGVKLGNDGMAFLRRHQEAIERHLQSAATPSVSEHDTPPLTWGQTARILYAGCPEGKDRFDWSYFVTEMGKVMRNHFGVEVEQ